MNGVNFPEEAEMLRWRIEKLIKSIQEKCPVSRRIGLVALEGDGPTRQCEISDRAARIILYCLERVHEEL